jgi:hypothetical protein
MRKEDNITFPKLNNFTSANTNNNEVEEILDEEFKTMIIRMINEIKEDINKCLHEFQENSKS